MDRIDAMSAFVATVEAGGFTKAARKLGRSVASITRAVAFLERRVGSQLLVRTTRSSSLTQAGEKYLEACRRILADLAEAERSAATERAMPRGVLTVTAPSAFGRLHVRPIVDAYLDENPETQVRLSLLDRVVHLIDEGVDVAVRIAHMPDSSLVAVKVGEVRRIVCASPTYLQRRGRPRAPGDLRRHDCISFSQATPSDAWAFSRVGDRSKLVKIGARLTVNVAEAAIASAVAGHGVTSVLSYQVEVEIESGKLVRILSRFEPAPVPVYLVFGAGNARSAKVRAFVDLAVPRLRSTLVSIEATYRKKRN